jgi:hypothetical protein
MDNRAMINADYLREISDIERLYEQALERVDRQRDDRLDKLLETETTHDR